MNWIFQHCQVSCANPHPIPSVPAPQIFLLPPRSSIPLPSFYSGVLFSLGPPFLFLIVLSWFLPNNFSMAFATINSSAANRRHVPNTVIPSIEDAFAAEPNLKKRVYDAIGAYTYRHNPSKCDGKIRDGTDL